MSSFIYKLLLRQLIKIDFYNKLYLNYISLNFLLYNLYIIKLIINII